MGFKKNKSDMPSLKIKKLSVDCPDYSGKKVTEQIEAAGYEDEPVTEEKPEVEEAPVIIEEETAVDDEPVTEEKPAVEEAPVIEEEMAVEEAPVIKEEPVVEEKAETVKKDEHKKEKKFKRKRKSKKKWLIGFFLILIIAAGCFAAYYFGIPGIKLGDEVFVEKVSVITNMGSGNGIQNRYAGIVESQNVWNIMQEPDKTIKKIYVKEGDTVKVGDKLFEYDNEEARLNLEQAKLELERMKSEIKAGELEIESLEQERASAADSDKIEYTLQIQSQKAANKKTEYEMKAQKAKIEALEKTAGQSVIKSELAGTVKRINTSYVGGDSEVQNSFGDDDVFMTVLATGDYCVKALINEQNQWMIEEGAEVIIRSRVDDDARWTGTITSIDLDKPQSNNGESDVSSSTSYPFYVKLDSVKGLILGQHVYIEMNEGQDEKKEGLWLDSYYIVETEEGNIVWAESGNGHLEKRIVELGEYDPVLEKYEILSGLSTADYIAFPEDGFHAAMRTTHSLGEEVETDENADEQNPEKESDDNQEDDLENAVGKATVFPEVIL